MIEWNRQLTRDESLRLYKCSSHANFSLASSSFWDIYQVTSLLAVCLQLGIKIDNPVVSAL